jgi:protein-S-isoprenylcysteine O-methyltransferase Ste14
MTPQSAIIVAWAAWIATWLAAAFWSTRAAARPPLGREVVYRAFNFAGAFMLFGVRAPQEWFGQSYWEVGNSLGWSLVALAIAGFAFTWWARIHLGLLWSANVTRKAGHHVVDTGPYALVRHPIYTGIILATIATVAMRATLIAAAGGCIMSIGWYIKAKLEEHFLRDELGATQYDSYAARVPMLVPFTRWAR